MRRRSLLALPGLLLSQPVRAEVATDPALAVAGWTHAPYDGLRPARFRGVPDGISIEGTGEGSFVWRRVSGAAGCLSWRWRVDAAPPPTDLTRKGGDDRAIAISVGFAGWPPRATGWNRMQHAVAQARAGSHALPRSVLIYVWGGTGREPNHFYSPWIGALGRVHVRRAATTPTGRWFEERVDLAQDWRESFGAEPPPVQEIAIGSDAEDTGARVSAMVERIRLQAC